MLMLAGSVFSGGAAKRSVDTEDTDSRTQHMGHQMNPGLEGRAGGQELSVSAEGRLSQEPGWKAGLKLGRVGGAPGGGPCCAK